MVINSPFRNSSTERKKLPHAKPQRKGMNNDKFRMKDEGKGMKDEGVSIPV